MTDPEWTNDPILADGGECGELMRQHDWRASPLGPPATWSKELRTLVGVMLGSHQPMLIVWGPSQTTLYNDGYAPMCGERHPDALGRPFRDLWFDIWDLVDPILSAAYSGVGTHMDDIQFTMHRKGYPEETHFAFSYTPVRDESGSVLGMFCACVETTEQVIARRAQRREREHLQAMFELAPGGMALLSGRDHVFEFANQSYRTLVGHRDIIGKPVAEALPEVEAQGFVALLNTVFATGKPYVGENSRIELQHTPDGSSDVRILDFVYQPIKDAAGAVDGIFVQFQDVTDRKDAEQRQDLLNHELSHRMKNQLSVVAAVVSQTLRSAKDLPSAGKSISGRISALSRTHDMLLAGSVEQSTMRDVVHAAVGLHDDVDAARFDISGGDLRLVAKPALSLSLLLHELTTNAIKYGALSAPGGRVQVTWEVVQQSGGPCFRLSWRETGGPPPAEPEVTGSGTRLIQAVVADVSGAGEFKYEPAGLTFTLEAPLESLQTE